MRLPYAIFIALLTFIAGGLLAAGAVFGVLSQQRGEAAPAPAAEPPVVAAPAPAPAPVPPPPTEVVALVVKHKITQWSTLRAPDETFEQFAILSNKAPANFVPADRLPELKGRRTRATLREGTILTEDHLLKKEISGIDGMLDRGKRAMAIPITADKAVGFFVVPGSKVDIIHTNQGVARVVLENVLVLAVDQFTKRPEDQVGAVGLTATLQMDSTEDVLKLAAALDRGTVRLALRPPNDDSHFEGNEPVPPPPVAPPPPAPPFEDPIKEKKGVERNKFAASVPIKAGRAVKPLLVPGSRVDIMHVDKGETRALLTNVVVLDVELAERIPPSTISDAWLTVQLDDHGQMLKLIQARKTGSLTVVMRSAEKKPSDD